MSASIYQWLGHCQLTQPGTPNLKVDNGTNHGGATSFPNSSESDTHPDCDFGDDSTSSWSSASSDKDYDPDDLDNEARNCVLDSSAWAYGDSLPGYVGSIHVLSSITLIWFWLQKGGINPPKTMAHSDQISLIHAFSAYQVLLAELRSVRAHNLHLFVEHGRCEENFRRREAQYLFQAKRHTDYAVDVQTKLDKLEAGIHQRYKIDMNQYLSYHSCSNSAWPVSSSTAQQMSPLTLVLHSRGYPRSSNATVIVYRHVPWYSPL